MKNLSINQKLIISFILICCVSAVMYVITRIDLNIANNNDIVLRSNNGLNTNYINDIIYIDFETKKHILPHSFSAISKTNSLSGQNSTFINDQNDFSATITLDLDEINIEKLNKVHLNYWYYPTKEKINASVVVSIFDKESGEQIFWDCQRIVSDNIKPDYWHNKGKTFNIPDSIKKENSNLRIYALGGMDNSKVYFDDFEIAFAEDHESKNQVKSKNIDYENLSDRGIAENFGHKSQKSALAKGVDSYSYAHTCKLADFDIETANFMNYSFYYYSEKDNIDFVLVFDFKDEDNNTIHWYGHQLKTEDINNQWNSINSQTYIPEEIFNNKNNYVSIYAWNRNNNTVYVDDVYFILKNNKDLKQGNKILCDLNAEPEFSQKINQPPYPFTYLQNKLNNKLTLDRELLNINICAKISIFNNEYEQIIAGSRAENLNCYYFENNQLKSKPFKLNISASTRTKLIGLDVDNDNIDELIVFDNKQNKISCLKILPRSGLIKTKEIYSINYSQIDSNFKPKEILRISKNKNQACLCINENGSSHILYTESNELKHKILPNKFNQFQSAFLLKENLSTENELLVFSGNDNRSNYTIYKFQGEIPNIKLASSGKPINSKYGYDGLLPNAKYICVNSKLNSRILMFDRTWRFDLKEVIINKNLYEILSNIDFNGFSDKNNPKYYPNTTIIAGNFYGDNEDEIMVFSVKPKSKASNNQKITNSSNFLISKLEIYEFE